MAKKKPKAEPRKVTDLPPRPPQDLNEAVLFGALSEVTEADVKAYVSGLYGKVNAKERKAAIRAMFKLATVGFAFRNWHLNRQ